MKKLITIALLFLCSFYFAQPANDNCTSATSLTPGAALLCAQNSLGATLQTGECFSNYAGVTNVSMWYRFTATNDSLVLNFIKTNSTNSASPHIRVYGPFGAGQGCLPACTSAIFSDLLGGDPGNHILLTNLATTGNNQYLIQIQALHKNGSLDSETKFCINVISPAANAYVASATLINACGSAFAGTSNGGFWNNGAGTSFSNLDNNAGTTCPTCAAGSGNDSPFIINNVSWFQFCSATAGTWEVKVDGVTGCTLPAPNQGVQASVFTGATTALSNQGNSQNPIPPGGSWTSPVITVNAGSCAYLMIDGFAGDGCNYNVTLTNLTGGCVLPIELTQFSGYKSNSVNVLEWTTQSEKNSKEFIIERSADGKNWKTLGVIPGHFNSTITRNYYFTDNSPSDILNYYRLKQTDVDNRFEYFKMIFIDNRNLDTPKIQSVNDLLGNNYGQTIPTGYRGVLILKYDNGTCKKIVVSE